MDRRKRGSFGYDDFMEMFKDSFQEKGKGKTSKEDFRKLLGYISPNSEINYEDFYNILNNEKFINY